MRVYIAEKPKDGLTKRQEARISLGKDRGEVSAVMLSANEATARVERTARLLFFALGALFVVLIGGAAVGVLLTDDATLPKPFLVSFMAFAAIVCAVAIRFGQRRMARRWQESLALRRAMAPPTGATIAVTDEGLTYGGRFEHWDALLVNTIWLVPYSDGDGGGGYLVERMLVSADNRSILLDAPMLDEGRALVDKTYRRMRGGVRAALGIVS